MYTLLTRSAGREVPWRRLCDLARDGTSESLHFIPSMPPLKRHQNMQPLPAGSLEEARESQFLEQESQTSRTLESQCPGRFRARIKVKNHPIWLFNVIQTVTPEVQFEDIPLNRSYESFYVLQRDVRIIAFIGHRSVTQVIYRRTAQMLLEETVGLNSLGTAE